MRLAALSLLLLVSVSLLPPCQATNAAPAAANHSCDRDGTRYTRAQLAVLVEPVLREAGAALTAECLLGPAADRFAALDALREVGERNRGVCGVCGKQFESGPFLDRHMEARHRALLPAGGAGSGCLDDLCELVHCDLAPPRGPTAVQRAARQPCFARHMAELRDRCEQLLRDCLADDAVFARVADPACAHLTCEYRASHRSGVASPMAAVLASVASAAWYLVAAVCTLALLLYYYAMYFRFCAVSWAAWFGVLSTRKKTVKLY